jgi:hypothetical protein
VSTAQLAALRESLGAWQSGECNSRTFVSDWREQSALLHSLPDKYATVFNNLLLRVESSALFTEESCSFSAKELADSLAVWLAKATAQLEKATAEKEKATQP